ncbi:MAG TPA: pyridoxal phosphate-dependent aminotransferase, partial [Treponema sp.]|nr:pyridoxal phosphate-dependent aminotransferase [Treponema sp.]
MTSPQAGVIRRMFEEGIKLKAIHGADNVFDFSLGNPDLDPPDSVCNEIERLAKDR